MNDNVAVKLANISKKYTVFHQKPSLIGNMLGRQQSEDFWALKDINLTIRKGDRIGIIGPNGAGKTTLLKIIAGITKPTSGIVKTNGTVVALIDLEAGFHPDLTGEENIVMNGLLVGMSRSEVNAKKQQIIKFADIGNFVNTPFHTYSAGMKFRLAFAVAVASECEVLIMDEVFVAGDIEFQEKSTNRLNRFFKKNITTIICSHIPFYVWQNANTFFTLKKGVIRSIRKDKIETLRQKEVARWKKIYPDSQVFI